MRTILILLLKEFRQTFRNPAMVRIIFIVPVVQLLVLANAATFEVKNIRIHILDFDHSPMSERLTHKIAGSEYFQITGASFSRQQAEADLIRDRADLILEIPPRFERGWHREGQQKLQLTVNAIDAIKAGLGTSYLKNVIRDFNEAELRTLTLPVGAAFEPPMQLRISYHNWYNPELNYKYFMVPGILVLLVTLFGMFLSAMNIVREKEIGTIEQLNVTPIRKLEFIVGKLLPFWLLALFVLGLGLALGKLFYDIPLVGSIPLLYAFAGVYLLAVLGLGLLISSLSETQQQAMFVTWFFLVIFILMSGMFTAIENMPEWAQTITLFNPIRYFIEVVRMVLLKGSGFRDIQWHFGVMALYAVGINALAVWRYRKTV